MNNVPKWTNIIVFDYIVVTEIVKYFLTITELADKEIQYFWGSAEKVFYEPPFRRSDF